ncbi:MAG: hypothetical protein KA714_22935 [Limnoraphis sp. WC205]|nr:hypothetical protein [Limnoraphis sp. WC205]
MNPIDKSQHFHAIYKRTEELIELGGSRLSQETVESILSIARVITEIGKDCDRFRAEIQQQLEPRAKAVTQTETLEKVQEQLSRIIEVSQAGDRPAKTVQDLISSVGKWRENFVSVLHKIEVAEQEARVKEKRLNLDLELKELQNTVLNSSHSNAQKLEILKELLTLENQLQSLQHSFQSAANWKDLEREINQLAEQLKAVQTELETDSDSQKITSE